MLRIETCVVEVPRASALVKSVHIIPLKMRFNAKKKARTMASKIGEDVGAWRSEEMNVARPDVTSDVVLEMFVSGV